MNILKRIEVTRRRKPAMFMTVVGLALGLFVSGTYWIRMELLRQEALRTPKYRTWGQIIESDTLRMATIGGSTSVFLHRGVIKGFEYEAALQVAKALDLQLSYFEVESEQALLDSLFAGVADVAMWPVARSVAADNGYVQAAGHRYGVEQVLLSGHRLNPHGKEEETYSLAVIEGSRQWQMFQDSALYRVDSLGQRWLCNMELTAFRVDTLPSDSMTQEEVVAALVDGVFDATLVETNRGTLFKSYYRGMVMSAPLVGSMDTLSWLVSVRADTLRAKIDSVTNHRRGVPRFTSIMKRYYEQGRVGWKPKTQYAILGNGQLSVFDHLFRQYATAIGWDWRLLAAVAYCESMFQPDPISSKNARGIMQLMPGTAERFGCPPEMIEDPESNIAAGAGLIGYLEKALRKKILVSKYHELQDKDLEPNVEQIVTANRDLLKFTLASYNSGLGHVFDAIVLADSLGYDPAIWEHHVEHCLALKVDPEIYNLPYVKLGRFNGRMTIGYVQKVLDVYENFKDKAPLRK